MSINALFDKIMRASCSRKVKKSRNGNTDTNLTSIRSEKEYDNISTNVVTVLELSTCCQPMKSWDLASSVQREE